MKKSNIKKALLFTLIIIPIAAVAGYFTAIYTFESYTEEIRTQLLYSVGGSYNTLLLMTSLQSVVYAAICGFLGHILAQKLGIMRPIRFEGKALKKAVPLTIVMGILFSLDYWTFGRLIPELKESYANYITLPNFISSVLYGGIIEEVMLRLFVMSLITLILYNVFLKKRGESGLTLALISGNILAAILFAAGHIPATISLFGHLTPLILIRCFLLNSGLGLAFGRLYRKYGIQYAMLSHAGCHIISKFIWMIFI